MTRVQAAQSAAPPATTMEAVLRTSLGQFLDQVGPRSSFHAGGCLAMVRWTALFLDLMAEQARVDGTTQEEQQRLLKLVDALLSESVLGHMSEYLDAMCENFASGEAIEGEAGEGEAGEGEAGGGEAGGGEAGGGEAIEGEAGGGEAGEG